MNDFSVHLAKALDNAHINLSGKQTEQLVHHFLLLNTANREFNLTAITDPLAAAEKHYFDSLLTLPALQDLPAGAKLLDIGSGGGFPGLVLAVARPDLQLTLLEATAKKCDFLRRAADELMLDNVRVVNLRAEEAGREEGMRSGFDSVTARAVAALNVLVEYALPLLKEGGLFVALKGASVDEEISVAKNALNILGGRIVRLLPSALAGGEKRCIVVIEKCAPTPEKYPRRNGMPNKRPL